MTPEELAALLRICAQYAMLVPRLAAAEARIRELEALQSTSNTEEPDASH